MATDFEKLYSGERLPELGKLLNLINYLPDHLRGDEIEDFLQFFQDFLNNLYYDLASERGQNNLFDISAVGADKIFYELAVSGNGEPALTSAGLQRKDTVTSASRVSLLEKAKRISDLHDPDMIDIEYIQRLGTYLGYDIGLSKAQLGNFGALTEEETNKYLRFVISNLPNWYKIKSTNNAVKVLLFSFGLIGDLVERWTSDQIASSTIHPTTSGYGNEESYWETTDNTLSANAIDQVPENYFLTPHFIIRINSDVSTSTFITTEKLADVIDAIETIRPINTVFDALEVYLSTDFQMVFPQIDTYTEMKMVFDFNESVPTFDIIYVETMSAADIFEEYMNANIYKFTFEQGNGDYDAFSYTGPNMTSADPVQDNNTQGYWSSADTDTVSNNIGPHHGADGDENTPDDYIYTEMSGQNPGDVWNMTWDQIMDASVNNYDFQFRWCARGDNVGALIVVETNEAGAGWVRRLATGSTVSGGDETIVGSSEPDATTPWYTKSVDLTSEISASSTQVRISISAFTDPHNHSNAFHNDIGIDSVIITETPKTSVEIAETA